MKLTLTPEERAEYEALLAEAAGHDSSARAVRDAGARLLELLDDAEQAGRTWASRVRSEFAEAGAQSAVRREIKRGQVTYKAKSGSSIPMSSRAGVRRETPTGEVVYQQVLFGDLTRTELLAHLALLDKQLTAVGARKGALKRLVAVLERHPDAATVAEALAAEGRNLDDVLGSAA